MCLYPIRHCITVVNALECLIFHGNLFILFRPGATSRSQRITQCCNDLKRKLVELNSRRKAELEDHLGMAVTNYLANIQWRFLNPNGPKIEMVTKEEPLMHK